MEPMSSHLGSQDFPIPSKQMEQMQSMFSNSGLRQLSLPSKQIGQMENTPKGPGSQQSPLPNKQMGQVEPVSNNPEYQQLSIPNKQTGLMEPLTNGTGSQHFSLPNKRMGQIESGNAGCHQLLLAKKQMDLLSNNLGSQELFVPNNQMGLMESTSYKPGSEQLLISNKQMTQLETVSNNQGSQKPLMQHTKRAVLLRLSVPNKQVVQIEPMSGKLGLQQLTMPKKRTVQMQSMYSNQGTRQLSAPSKQAVQMESVSNKPGSQQSIPQKRIMQMEPSPKGRIESFESVRSKLRESLAASLALVSQQQNKPSTEGKSNQSEAPSTPRQVNKNPKSVESTSTALDVSLSHVPEKLLNTLSSKDHDTAQKNNDGQYASEEISSKNNDNSMQALNCDGQEFQLANVLAEDVPFNSNLRIKDELLQGIGLCWGINPDLESSETKEIHSTKRPKLEHGEAGGNRGEPAVRSPQTMAIKIEAELFKLFGGVNKKYRERGRSLMFNLKDLNNPELRERVVSGDITPDRLCSMTAEELASKELSQWRKAKAEELSQMIFLPDSEVDIRRLVRKTHKGEFQVEVEQDDSVSVEVAVEDSSLAQIRSKDNEMEAQFPSKSSEMNKEVNEKSNLEDQNLSSSVGSPHDKTDLMEGLMVDEIKNEESLLPIVSLDEFMESLDSEPPFENLSVDTREVVSISDEKKSSEVISKLDSSDLDSGDPENTAPDKPDKMHVKSTNTDDGNLKSVDTHTESESHSPNGAPKGEHVWEGVLQLNFSATVTVTGLYKSGEKASTKDWPSFLEIKGRVRSDAFEKFLQELRMSRSRAIMIVQFCLKEGSPESGQASLCEVVDSYFEDEKVGFAEPAPGVELYFCPPHIRTIEMLDKHLPNDHSKTLDANDKGLIGIVIWRKALVSSTLSPRNSSHHKQHNSKKQLRRRQEKETNANAYSTSKLPVETTLADEPIDEVPPGFGPSGPREEDDLPEFDYVRGSNLSIQNSFQGQGRIPFHPPQPRPVEQMRELVHKYGQGKAAAANSLNWQHRGAAGVEVQPWDDDDDDDIPEWQPQPLKQQQLPPQPPLPVYGLWQPPPPPIHMVNQQQFAPISNEPPQPPRYPSQPFAAPLPMAMQQPMQLSPQMNMMQGQQSFMPACQQGAWWGPPPASHR